MIMYTMSNGHHPILRYLALSTVLVNSIYGIWMRIQRYVHIKGILTVSVTNKHVTQEPYVSTSVGSGRALNKLAWDKEGNKTAIGSSDGRVYLYDIGEVRLRRRRTLFRWAYHCLVTRLLLLNKMNGTYSKRTSLKWLPIKRTQANNNEAGIRTHLFDWFSLFYQIYPLAFFHHPFHFACNKEKGLRSQDLIAHVM